MNKREYPKQRELHNNDDAHIRAYRTEANSIARSNGYGTATKIVRGPESKLMDHVDYGYRKYTTGQYVARAYLNNFGWKNTYYQHAETVVMLKG